VKKSRFKTGVRNEKRQKRHKNTLKKFVGKQRRLINDERINSKKGKNTSP